MDGLVPTFSILTKLGALLYFSCGGGCQQMYHTLKLTISLLENLELVQHEIVVLFALQKGLWRSFAQTIVLEICCYLNILFVVADSHGFSIWCVMCLHVPGIAEPLLSQERVCHKLKIYIKKEENGVNDWQCLTSGSRSI